MFVKSFASIIKFPWNAEEYSIAEHSLSVGEFILTQKITIEERSLMIDDACIAYTIKRSRRRRRSLSIGVSHRGVTVNAPVRASYLHIEQLILKHVPWITKKLAQWQHRLTIAPPENMPSKAEAEKLLPQRVMIYQERLGIHCRQLKIANQKSQWGNCNRQGVVRLNWRLIFVPLELIDYVVVHELCHLVHFNHSPAFWRLVEKYVPDYKNKRKALRKMSAVFSW